MAEKKKVEREFVEVSTGKTGKRPAVVTAANKKSATGKRVAAVILWVLALAAEVGAILMLNGQTAEELRQLREKQALHRRQLEENRQKALDKKKQTRRYVNLGKMVEGMIPGADRQSEDEILDYLEKHLPFSGKPIP